MLSFPASWPPRHAGSVSRTSTAFATPRRSRPRPLNEAAVLGLKALKKSEWIETVGAGTRIDIEVLQPPVAHFMMYAQLMRWLDGGGVNPAEILRKKKLRELLAS
jgi:hypothetical protein